MLNTNFSVWPSYTEEEAEAVKGVLLSNKVNYWTGNETKSFEKEFASWVGVEYAVALANGTVALDIALKALEIGPGDEVVVTSRTFIASVSCIINAGASPVFADVDINSQNITAATIKAALTSKTKAIICVHLAGWPCDMDPIMELAEVHNLYVVEDCAQAHGALYKGKSVGSIGHVGAWSFCQDKIMTTGGEGGMVTTNIEHLWSKMWSFKDHGKSTRALFTSGNNKRTSWIHDGFGTNWRMTELQAVIGRIQLSRMNKWHDSRVSNLKKIWGTARMISGLRVPRLPENIEHAGYKCYVFVDANALKKNHTRDSIIDEINKKEVPCFYGSCSEVYLEKAFDNTAYRPKTRLPVAKKLGSTSLMFMIHPTLTVAEIEKTCAVLTEVMSQSIQDSITQVDHLVPEITTPV